jgi:DNA-binding GntR family transcriptional regulator
MGLSEVRTNEPAGSHAMETRSTALKTMPAEDEATKAASGLDRNCMHDRIRWTILERIMDGTYQPGDRLKELTLAREFHVSQAPVREALRKLEAIGVLKSDPYRGTRVRELSPTELRDAYQLRGILEQSATEFITEFSDESVEYLEQEYVCMQQAVQARDLQSFACHNRNFHRRIMDNCGNKELFRVWQSLGICMRSRLNAQRIGDDLPEAITSHQPIIDAFRIRDFRSAGQLLREHSFRFVSDLL